MRAIDADALIPMMKYATTDNEIGVFPIKIGFDAIVKVINDSPTIEPQRKKGKWISIGMADAVDCEPAMWGDEIAYHICEKCLKQALERDSDEVLSDFCPNCGARMEDES